MEGCAFRAYIPALNGEVLRANPIKKPRRLDENPTFWVSFLVLFSEAGKN